MVPATLNDVKRNFLDRWEIGSPVIQAFRLVQLSERIDISTASVHQPVHPGTGSTASLIIIAV